VIFQNNKRKMKWIFTSDHFAIIPESIKIVYVAGLPARFFFAAFPS